MFSENKKLIIFLSRDLLKVYYFYGPDKSPKEVGEIRWTKENLGEVLEKIKKESNEKKIRVLLSEDLGYLLETEIPLEEKEERKYLSQIIMEKIPEKLEDNDWDFMEIGRDKQNKKVRVFTPVKEIWQIFTQAALNVGLKIEAVETVALAVKRDKNPIVGLGLKKDIQGKDEDVLNIVPVDAKKEIEEEKEDKKKDEEETDSPKPKKKTSTIILLIILLLLSAVCGFFLYRNYFKKQEKPLEQKVETASPSSEPAVASPSAVLVSEKKLNRKDLLIQVLNGTGVAGMAGEMVDFLEGLGYQNIEIGNAESFDYIKTVIKIKEAKKEYLVTLVGDLKDKYSTENIEVKLDKDNEFDAIIIIGKE